MPRMVVLATIVGIVGGLGAVGFHYLILLFKYVFWGATSTATFLDSVRSLPWYWRILAPAVGGLIVGPLVTYVVKEAKGHGVPEVMESVVLRGGSIRFRVAPLKAVISAICIGSGGAAGREGPIVQIGATFGSAFARFLKLTPQKVETLLAAGAAAGIAGTFNAPLAGVIFSMEVLVKKIKLDSFSPIIVAAVVGTAVANSLFNRTTPIFDIPVHELVSYWELFFYVGLGIVGGLVALLYQNSLYATEHFFESLPFPPRAIKAAVGGLMLGLLALTLPQIHSTGYPVMESALHSRLSLGLVFALLLGKILATSLTLGSGGSGGIFAPALFIGSMMGAAYGMIVHSLFPNVTAPATSYAAIGMGTVFAGATHAPLTAIIILFEMTRDPKIMVPMMLACIIASVLTKRLQKWNIYTKKLLNRGIDIDAIAEEAELLTLVERLADRDLTSGSIESQIRDIIHERGQTALARFDHLVRTALVLDIEEHVGLGECLHRVAAQLGPRLNMAPRDLADMLRQREEEGRTLLTRHLAVPHVVIPGEKRFGMAIVRAREGVLFSEDAPAVNAIFILAGTEDERDLHLRALTDIAETASGKRFLQRWMAARSEEHLRQILLRSKRETHNNKT